MVNEVKESSEMESPLHRFDEETQSEKLARKAREAPFVPVGILGCMAVVAYGAYKFKHRGNMSTSIFLMQLRVAAQGTVVACLTGGVLYTMARDYLFKSSDTKKSS